MLHYNKQFKYQNLYKMLKSLTEAYSLQSLYFQQGSISGWCCARYPVEWSNQELERYESVVKEIVKVKEKELKEHIIY